MRRPLPNAADPAADGVELAWLRRTDAVADPVILAQSLCGEIAPLVSAERVNYLTTHDGRSQLIASSTTAIIDPRSTEAARLSQLADEVCRTGTDVLTDPTSTDPAATSADATETLAIPVMTDESVDQVQGVIVIQRYAPQPTLLFDAIAAFRSEIDAAAAKVAAALRWRATTTERPSMIWWRSSPNWQKLAAINVRLDRAMGKTLQWQLESARVALQAARSTDQVRDLEAEIQNLKLDLARLASDEHHIESPIGVTVVSISARAGDWVRSGQVVARIIDRTRLRAEGDLSTEHANAV